MSRKGLMIRAACIGIFATLISVSLISAAVQVDTSALREAVTVEGVRDHLSAFQTIAEGKGGTRASGTGGYDYSAAYVADQLQAAGYNVTLQEFVFDSTETANVIAETPGGRDDRVVVVGAHLDSVPEGPGIQDNGSGSAAILEIALQMAELDIEPRNKVRFVFWGANENGIIGSQYYVDTLSRRDIRNIALYLNFDMIGSPNFVRFVYDGDGSDTPLAGPNGSANIERIFLAYFAEQGLAVKSTALDWPSDHLPFLDVGVPVGGLFTGAKGIKTEEEATIFGGTAGEQYDPCYHLACDTSDNISLEALDQMSDAAAHAVLTFAETTSEVSGVAMGKGLGLFK
jgi:Zn-dependent M28 family amino/carboxypeptidase